MPLAGRIASMKNTPSEILAAQYPPHPLCCAGFLRPLRTHGSGAARRGPRTLPCPRVGRAEPAPGHPPFGQSPYRALKPTLAAQLPLVLGREPSLFGYAIFPCLSNARHIRFIAHSIFSTCVILPSVEYSTHDYR